MLRPYKEEKAPVSRPATTTLTFLFFDFEVQDDVFASIEA
jgi:hypothetical protein